MAVIKRYRYVDFTDKFKGAVSYIDEAGELVMRSFDKIYEPFQLTTPDDDIIFEVRAVETTSNVGINKKYLATSNTAGTPISPPDANISKDFLITYNGVEYFLKKRTGYQHLIDGTGFLISGNDLIIQLAT